MQSSAVADLGAAVAAAASRPARRWAIPSTPHFERQVNNSSVVDESGSVRASIADASAVESHNASSTAQHQTQAGADDEFLDAASPPRGRRLSAFMRERLAAFSPKEEPPLELDPEHRGHWTPAALSSPDASPQQHSITAGDSSRLNVTHGDAQRSRTGSGVHGDVSRSADVPVLHGGAPYSAYAGVVSPSDSDESDDDGGNNPFDSQQQQQYSVVYDEQAPLEVSFGVMPTMAESEAAVGMAHDGVGDSPRIAAVEFDSDGGGDVGGNSVVSSILAALNRPSFMGDDEAVDEVDEEEDPRRASQLLSPVQASSQSPSSVHASPAAATTNAHPAGSLSSPSASSEDDFIALAAGMMTPSSYFAARSAPLGSLDPSHGAPRPTFNTPGYITNPSEFSGYMGAHNASFVSPRNVGPVLYHPTPGNSRFTSPAAAGAGATPGNNNSNRMQPVSASKFTPQPSHNSSTVPSAQRSARSPAYTVTVTPAQAMVRPGTAASASSSRLSTALSPPQSFISPAPHSSASTRAGGGAGGLFGDMASPSPIQPHSHMTNGSSRADTSENRAGLAHSSPHDVRTLAHNNNRSSLASSPLTSSVPASAPDSGLRGSPASSSPATQRTPLARTSLTTKFGRASRTPIGAEESMHAGTEESLPPSPTAARAAAARSSMVNSFALAASAVTSSPTQPASTRTSLAASPARPVASSPARAVASSDVQHTSRLQKLHRFALFQVDPAALLHRSASSSAAVTEADLLVALTPLVESYVSSTYPSPVGSAPSPLAFHALKQHSSREHTYTLVVICEDGGSAAIRKAISNDQWRERFEFVFARVCAHTHTPAKRADEPERPPTRALSFLELRPAHWL